MNERVLKRSFDGPPELGPRNQEGVNVDAIGIERDRSGRTTLLSSIVTSIEVDVGLRPDGIVRQAAAEERGQDAPILLDLVDECVEGRR